MKLIMPRSSPPSTSLRVFVCYLHQTLRRPRGVHHLLQRLRKHLKINKKCNTSPTPSSSIAHHPRNPSVCRSAPTDTLLLPPACSLPNSSFWHSYLLEFTIVIVLYNLCMRRKTIKQLRKEATTPTLRECSWTFFFLGLLKMSLCHRGNLGIYGSTSRIES